MLTDTEVATTEETEAETDTATEVEDTDEDEVIEGADELADAGKKALDTMKAQRAEARRERAAALEEAAQAKAETARLKAEAEGRQAEHEAEMKAREVERAALAKANDRILKAEVRAQAAGKLADPKDALLHIDLEQFEVDDDGNVDTDAITEAINDLISTKPYLAAQGGARFQGTADQGVRKGTVKSQLTQADIESMTDQEIQKAKQEGRLDKLLGRTK